MEGKTKKYLFRLAPIVLLAVLLTWAESKAVFVLSDSVSHKLMYRSEETVHKGDYVMFPLVHEYLGTGDTPQNLTKIYRCAPGDVLQNKKRLFFCNGEYIGRAKERGYNGQPLQPFEWNGPIPDGKAFVAGEHADSFDSRYWGFVDIVKLKRVVPIV